MMGEDEVAEIAAFLILINLLGELKCLFCEIDLMTIKLISFSTHLTNFINSCV